MCQITIAVWARNSHNTREGRQQNGTALNKTRSTALYMQQENEKTTETLALKVPLRDNKNKLAVRSSKLWLSLKKLHDEKFITRRRKTYSKDWICALNFNSQRLCLNDIDEWLRNSSIKSDH